MWRTHALVLGLLAALAIVAYLPVFTQPLMQDDYPLIEQARLYGPAAGWHNVLADSAFRYRSTFFLLTGALDRLFGPSPLPFYMAALALHILCTWLVYALGAWRIVGGRVATIAAGFFAVCEGHQEAIMWYSAVPESLQFLFGVAALLCWIRFVEKRGRWRWYAASLGLFVLALASKESAVIFAPLLLVLAWASGTGRRRLAAWLPFAALAAADVWLIFWAQPYSFRLADGSFSFHAPFWITLPVSYARLLWFWGLLSLLLLAILRARLQRQLVLTALVWMPVALLPYSFPTYMHRVPSRQTYLASLGLAWLVAAGFCAFRARLQLHRRSVTAVVVAIVLLANIGYLWTKKRRQFLERAAPTEALLALARKVDGPIYMRCYPGPPMIYEAALRLKTGKPASTLVWDRASAGAAAAEFCWTKPW